MTGALVKIGFFRTNAELLYHDEVSGDLFTQVGRTIDILRTKYMKAAITYRGIQRLETFGVPEAALREAVLNTIIHKAENREKLLRVLQNSPYAAADELAAAMGITRKGVEWQIRRLKQEGLLKRIGPDKGGRWEVVE